MTMTSVLRRRLVPVLCVPARRLNALGIPSVDIGDDRPRAFIRYWLDIAACDRRT